MGDDNFKNLRMLIGLEAESTFFFHGLEVSEYQFVG